MTKHKVLKILIQKNDYISGEMISNELGMTRAAVNLAVKSLRSDGYIIDSATNRGYYLRRCPDDLNEGEIAAYLSDERMDTVLFLPEVASTNDVLRTMAYENAPQGQVVISDHQTRGKGRQGKTFLSPSNAGIYFSYLFRPETQPVDTAEITAWSAVAVWNAIRNICQFEPEIKWINDLVVGERKLCGILTEMAMEAESGRVQFVIIGVGINCNETQEEFDEEIQDKATSIYQESGKKVRRGYLAAELIKEFDHMVLEWPAQHDKYLNQYRRRCSTLNRDIQITAHGHDENGFALEIDDGFGLLVRFDDGTTKILNSGEVSTRTV